MEESLFMDRVRDLFAMLDRMIYWLISVFYNTITDLATVQVISSDTINSITGRIYALLGVFMLFKVSFSLINYIVDPDQIADKAKGGGALIKNIVITFVLIISVPFGFNLLYEAQSAILSDQIIPQFIFGTDTEGSKSNTTYSITMDGCDAPIEGITNMGNYIGLAIFKPFFIEQEAVGDEEVGAFKDEMEEWYCTAGSSTGQQASVTNMLKKSDLYNSPKGWSSKKLYTMDYSIILSTAIGVVVALLFLSFCFDIAVRALKLLFLEMIAPIPIISFIDPNSAKSGMFKKWGKEVLSTWASLFIRLASVFLAIFVIQQITAENGKLYFLSGYNFGGSMLWLKLLLIIGALIFAKQLPKILEDILGLKLSGSMTLNPFKKLEKEALGGKAFGVAGKVAGGTAMAAGAIGLTGAGSAIANALAAEKGNKFKSAMKGLGTGSFYGATQGFKAGYGGKHNLFGTSLNAIEKNSKNRNLSEDLIKNGVVPKGPFALPRFMAMDKYTDIIGKKGSSGSTDELKDKISELNIAKQIAEGQQEEANRTLSNLSSSMSSITSNAVSSAGISNRSYNDLDKATGKVNWTNDISNMSASQYLRDNEISFSNEQEANKFISEFDAYINAEKRYRDSFNETLMINKEETSLSKSKDKVEGIKQKK